MRYTAPTTKERNMYTAIEETKKYLIEKHGEPIVKQENGCTIRTINTYLDSFTRFIDSLEKLIDTLEITNIDSQMRLICEYAKDAEYLDLDYINTKLKAMQRNLDKGKKSNALNQLFEDLHEISNNPKTDPRTVMKYFRHYLGNSMYKLNIDAGTYNYTRRDEYDLNLALQDNNL